MKKWLKIIGVLLLILVIGFLGYLESGHYDPDQVADSFSPTAVNDNYLTYDNDSDIGLIFYPGGKVDAAAYSYLSQLNVNVYIANFPFELAMFDYKVADQIIEENPQINSWYMGGHSLGGVFANRYAVTTENQIDGLVFLGSYPANGDQSDIPGLALFGIEDLVVGDYSQHLDAFTDADKIVILENANHSGFGNYGQQKGDSELSADAKAKQQEAIILDINQFISENQ